ncbi:MAG: SCP2 sterol-binding domain-containing protein [Clostridium sp.]
MTYEEVFTQIKSIFMEADVSGEKEHVAFQFNVTGEGEGAFYAEVKEGTLCVEPYEYYDRDAVFTCTADTLFKLASGKLDPIFAFTTGKLRVEGNLEKAMKLQNFVKSDMLQIGAGVKVVFDTTCKTGGNIL